MRQMRQGDVFLVKVEELPEKTEEIKRERGRIVLAHGEVTGHAHAISDKHVRHFRQTDAPTREGEKTVPHSYLVADVPALLKHEEHGPVTIPPGIWEVRRQREYHPAALRNVAD